ncbi:hypothetical protein BZG36_01019 [Bifiguratus adelaidae]|uniref:triacylglycerol lipase n=1 Tax=Bifiguratus adelaidae TaxID=1938954 RepID=A0A261Y6D2_9FUNG|nr:hypothetical protein BZG36_01019 [Bifiguratus adelaidae]
MQSTGKRKDRLDSHRNLNLAFWLLVSAFCSVLLWCLTSYTALRLALPSRTHTTSLTPPLPPLSQAERRLQLRHVFHHASSTGPYSGLFRRLDQPILPQRIASSGKSDKLLRVKSKVGTVYKPTLSYFNDLVNVTTNGDMRKLNQRYHSLGNSGIYQQRDDILPDVTDHETVLAFAKMTNNAYNDPVSSKPSDWYDLGEKWHLNSSWGWDTDGVRGHVYGDDKNTTFVLVIKGTTYGIADDKLNDNILFSCCCARVGPTWRTVCDCYRSGYQCNQTCLEESVAGNELYYRMAMDMYIELKAMYPNSVIWFSGHSLGGGVASLLGATFGVPTVAFQSPGDRLAARRLHLPGPPGIRYEDMPIWHFGNTADPVFMGVCTGVTTSCWYAGYALETKCHTGKTCVWDVVKEEGWRVDIRAHRITDVIERILLKNMSLPECVVETDCVDCGPWDYVDRDQSSKKAVAIAS